MAMRPSLLRALPLRAPRVRVPTMRTLGPGSVSSLLKVVLEVIHFALWVATAVVALAAIGLLLALPFRGLHLTGGLNIDGHAVSAAEVLRKGPAVAGLLGLTAVYLLAMTAIFNRLRRVFETLTAGDPFRPENVGRLRLVGFALVGLEGLSWLLRTLAGLIFAGKPSETGAFNLTAWFSILVVFVLAEVFREGARLRGEAELTI